MVREDATVCPPLANQEVAHLRDSHFDSLDVGREDLTLKSLSELLEETPRLTLTSYAKFAAARHSPHCLPHPEAQLESRSVVSSEQSRESSRSLGGVPVL